MKKKFSSLLVFGLLISCHLLAVSLFDVAEPVQRLAQHQIIQEDTLKLAALKILDSKCNVCHRKRNPFMVFKEKNMERRARKIYLQVFVTKRMPKDQATPLSEAEYATLKKWLLTQNL